MTQLQQSIEVQGQSVAVSGNVLGTPFSLHYRSGRTSPATRTVDIPVTGASLPAPLKRIRLIINVAGQSHTIKFDSPEPNLNHRFVWDGRDAEGRPVGGVVNAEIRLGYIYDIEYLGTEAESKEAFAQYPDATSSNTTSNRAREEVTLWQEWFVNLSTPNLREQKLGEWTFSNHHIYDSTSGRLFRGDGPDRYVSGALKDDFYVRTLAGAEYGSGGRTGADREGYPAREALLSREGGVTVGPDGSLYLGDRNVVLKVDPDGILTRVAGSNVAGTCTYAGEGGPATEAELETVLDVALLDDDLLVLTWNSCYGGHRILRVDSDGIITTFAGTGEAGNPNGTGGPAVDARIRATSMRVGPDGRVYLAEFRNVRRIEPDGTIILIAGGDPDGPVVLSSGAARGALISAQGVDVDAEGNLYIANADRVNNNHCIYRVGTDGMMKRIVGWRETQKGYAPLSVKTTPNGVYYSARRNSFEFSRAIFLIPTEALQEDRDDSNSSVELVSGIDPDVLQAVATYEDAPAQRSIIFPEKLDFGADGRLYFSEPGRISVLTLLKPPEGVPSADGTQFYQFSPGGRNLRTVESLGDRLIHEFGYDAAGLLTSITDGHGNVTTIERPDAETVVISAPTGQETVLQLNADGRLVSLTRPNGDVSTFTYNGQGLLDTVTDPLGNMSTYTYDDVGYLTKAVDPDSNATNYLRTEVVDGTEVTRISPELRETSYLIEFTDEGRYMRTNCCGGAMTDVLQRPDKTHTINYSDGRQTDLSLSEDPALGWMAPFVTEAILAPGNSVLAYERTAEVDGATGIIEIRTETTRVNDREYTLIIDVNAKTVTGETPEGLQLTGALDDHNQITELQVGSGDPIAYTYDSHGRLTTVSQGTARIEYTYDEGGRLSQITDAAGNSSRYEYDAVDRVTQISSELGNAFGLSYDAADNPIHLEMPNGAVHSFSYTPTGAPARYLPPDIADGGTGYAFTYDGDGHPTELTLPSGRTLTNEYDGRGLRVRAEHPDAAVSWEYEPTGYRSAGLNPTRIGRTPTAGSEESIQFQYQGNRISRIVLNDDIGERIDYTYDQDLQLEQVTFAGQATSITRDNDGRVVGYGPFTYTRGGPQGEPTAVSDGTLSVDTTWDGTSRIASRTASVGGITVYAVTYSYDETDRLIKRRETASDGTAVLFEYVYDADGQLVAVTRDGSVVEQYTYDANGNRTTVQYGTDDPIVAEYDAQDRIDQLGTTNYTFDTDGFLLERGGDTFQYSAAGELLQATAVTEGTVSYTYDGFSRRVTRTDEMGTERYYYTDPAHRTRVTAVRDASGTVTHFYYDTNGFLYAFIRGGSWYYVATDYVGSPRLVVDASGTVVKAVEYDAYGRVIADSAPSFDVYLGFASGLVDRQTGLINLGYRDYDPKAGRWTARDPALYTSGETNLYAYVENDPVNLIDPLGLASWSCWWEGTTGNFVDTNKAIYDGLNSVGRLVTGAALTTATAKTAGTATAMDWYRSYRNRWYFRARGAGMRTPTRALLRTQWLKYTRVIAAFEIGLAIGSAIDPFRDNSLGELLGEEIYEALNDRSEICVVGKDGGGEDC